MEFSQHQQVAITEESSVKARLDFAQRCFTNIQELIRLIDQKAGFLLAAVGLLTSAFAILVPKVLGAQSSAPGWRLVLAWSAMGMLLVYAILVFVVINEASKVYRASKHRRKPPDQAPGLIFPLIILDRYPVESSPDEGEEKYYAALATLKPQQILRDYANEILEISVIYKRKQQQINTSIDLFRWLAGTWLAAVLLLLALVVLG